MKNRRIAIIGARGIGNYGGFETLVSELAPRLRERGYEVLCSHRWVDDKTRVESIEGITPLYFPLRFPRNIFLSRIFELVYDWYFLLKCSLGLRCDLVYCLGTGAGFALPFACLSRSKTIVNIDGLEWKRAKFDRAQRSFIKLLYYSCYAVADSLLVDNHSLMEFIPTKLRKKAVFIPYGVTMPGCPPWDGRIIEGYVRSEAPSLMGKEYWLVVARLEPDNSIRTIVKAYSESGTTKPLLIVGSFASSRYENRVKDAIRDLPDGKNVIFAGSIFNPNHLTMLRCYAFAYIHGHSVGGTNPSLLEAMSVRSPVIVHDNVFNREVCEGGALFFSDASDLARKMDSLESNEQMRNQLGSRAREIASTRYRWDAVVDSYDELFLRA